MICDLARDELRRDGGTQARVKIPDGVVADYARAYERGDPVPPLVAFSDGKDHWLADGFIRDLALASLGCDTARVDVRQGTLRDAVLYAVAANHAHGLRRTPGDCENAVLMVLSLSGFWGKSDVLVGKAAKVTDKTVARVRRLLVLGELELFVFSTSEAPMLDPDAPRTGQDGKLRPAKKNRTPRPDDDDDDPEAGEEDETPPPPPQLLDGLGEPVPESLREVFLSRWKFERAAEAFRAAAGLAREAAESPGGRGLLAGAAGIGREAEVLAGLIESSAPHAVRGDGWVSRGEP